MNQSEARLVLNTVLVILATLATATVFGQLGWGGGTATKAVALVVVGQPFAPAQLVGGAIVAGSAFVVQRRG